MFRIRWIFFSFVHGWILGCYMYILLLVDILETLNSVWVLNEYEYLCLMMKLISIWDWCFSMIRWNACYDYELILFETHFPGVNSLSSHCGILKGYPAGEGLPQRRNWWRHKKRRKGIWRWQSCEIKRLSHFEGSQIPITSPILTSVGRQ